MNADRLLAHFERAADAPDSISRLRQFILGLAVCGKLAPQQAAWQTLNIEECLAPLADGRFIHQGWSPQCESLPSPSLRNWGVLKTTAVQDGSFLDNQNKALPPELDPKPLLEVKSGDILITCAGPRARCGISCLVNATREQLMISGKMYRFRANEAIVTKEYLSLFLRAEKSQAAIDAIKTGSSESGLNLTQDRFRTLQVSFGSVAEQRRIVANVAELMALCERLEAARAERESARDRLVAASLARLNAPAPDPDQATFANHVRFAVDALPVITTRPDQLKQLRQTILNLAVGGRLVRQDSSETVSLEPPNCDAPPESIPLTWRYTRLANLLAEDTRNGYSRKPDEAQDGVPILRISAGTVRRDGVVAEEEHKLISGIDSDTRLQFGLRVGDLLACRFNGNKSFVGRFTIFRDYLSLRPIYPDKLIRVRVEPRLASPEFLKLAGDTDLVRSEIEAVCATTVGNWGISASNLKEIRFPLPPLAEQRRIVAKVDELMALCDRLEASLAASDDTRRRLLDALLAEALAPIETLTESRDLGTASKRAVLAAEIVHRLHKSPTFGGRTKHQKALHLCEVVAGVREVGGNYYREAAGPYDGSMMSSVERILKDRGWYEALQQAAGSAVKYRPLENAGRHRDQYELLFSSGERAAVNKLLKLLAPMDTEWAEIVATLAAAWNDFLLESARPTDADIVREARTNWTPEKLRIPEARWREVLKWMREHEVVPKGLGRKTIRTQGTQAQLALG